MAKHRLTRGIKDDLRLISYQETLPNKQRHKAVKLYVEHSSKRTNPNSHQPYQLTEKLITMLVVLVSSHSQNIGWQWPCNTFFCSSVEQLKV